MSFEKHVGTIKYFSNLKGFGFIVPEDQSMGKPDIYFNSRCFKNVADVQNAEIGIKVLFHTKMRERGKMAVKIELVK